MPRVPTSEPYIQSRSLVARLTDAGKGIGAFALCSILGTAAFLIIVAVLAVVFGGLGWLINEFQIVG